MRNLEADDRVTLCVVQPGNLNRYVEIRGRAVVEPDVDRAFINQIARAPTWASTSTRSTPLMTSGSS